MSKPKKRRKKHGGGGQPVRRPDVHEELARLVHELDLAGEREGPVWGQIHRVLLGSPLDKEGLARVVAARDRTALERILATEMLDDFDPSATERPEAAPDLPEIAGETKKKALRAFRKKLKFARLDDESRLGVGPMTSGRDSEINAIIPPSEFERAVWDALVRDGALRDMKQGFYELAD